MADTLDILTLPEGQTAINNTPADTTELAQQITAVSRMIDAAVGPVVQRTVTAEIHDGGGPVWLDHQPVVSVSLVRSSSYGSLTTHSAVVFGGTGNGYYLDAANGRILRSDGGVFGSWDAGDQVEVTYVAGRYANTTSVDARFKACAASILRRLWKRESGTWAQSSSFFEGTDQSVSDIGFFRVARPIIDEMLADQRKPPAVA